MQVYTEQETFFPPDALKLFVWSLTINHREKAGDVRGLPDTGIVMDFQYAGKVSYVDNGIPKSLKSISIIGLGDRARTYRYSNKTSIVSVVFTDTGAATFFESSMHKLFGRCYSLEGFTSGWRKDNIVRRLRVEDPAQDAFKNTQKQDKKKSCTCVQLFDYQIIKLSCPPTEIEPALP
jgi:hypothetical protein